jgi:Fibronectin type III domain
MPGVPAAGNDMLPGEVLKANTSIMSTNGQFRLTYQDDANLVLYRTGDGAALWDTRPQPGGPGECIMQADGNLVVYNAAGAAVWASNTNGNPGAHLILQDDGNVVIYRPDGALLWARIIPAPSWANPAITALTETSVILHWQAVPAAQRYFIDYAYLSTGQPLGVVWETSYTEAAIPDLTPATGYEFHLTYRTVSGKYSDPAKIQLTTLAPSVSAVTEPATNIGADSATLNGTVQSADSAASYYFEYGLTTAYGTKAAGGPALSPGAVHQVSQAVSKLQSGATYHFRIVASNAKETATGNDAKFTTPAKSGIDFISLPQDAIGSFNYSADVYDPNEVAVDLGQATPARITALTSIIHDCSLSVGGLPRFNLIAGQTVTWFNGKLVKGTWSAEFSGSALNLPAGIPFRVTWTRP